MSAFLEIVELVNGDIVLQRAGGDGEALMTIRFSDESRAYLPEERLEVARAMIHAGIESASQLEFVRGDNAEAGEGAAAESGTLQGMDLGRDEGIQADDLSEDRVLH